MDRKTFVKKLNRSTNEILLVLKDCSIHQLHFKQENKWNILEIIEHLYLTDKAIKSITSRESEIIHQSTDIIGSEKLQKIMVEQRFRKLSTPDALSPKGEIKDLDTLLNMLITQRENWKQDLATEKFRIDNRIFTHPVLGNMTTSDWLNFVIHHTQRHIEQMKDTKTFIGY
jgi:transcriptional regulator of NAD metabolism